MQAFDEGVLRALFHWQWDFDEEATPGQLWGLLDGPACGPVGIALQLNMMEQDGWVYHVMHEASETIRYGLTEKGLDWLENQKEETMTIPEVRPELPDDSGEESVIEAFAVMGNGQLTVVRVAVRKFYGIDHDTPRGMMPQPVAFFVPTDCEFMVIDSAANLHELSVGEDAQIRPATIGHLRAVRDVIGRGLGL